MTDPFDAPNVVNVSWENSGASITENIEAAWKACLEQTVARSEPIQFEAISPGAMKYLEMMAFERGITPYEMACEIYGKNMVRLVETIGILES